MFNRIIPNKSLRWTLVAVCVLGVISWLVRDSVHRRCLANEIYTNDFFKLTVIWGKTRLEKSAETHAREVIRKHQSGEQYICQPIHGKGIPAAAGRWWNEFFNRNTLKYTLSLEVANQAWSGVYKYPVKKPRRSIGKWFSDVSQGKWRNQ
jgi:hypothetical protein